jgi:hypothetical protein
MSWHSMNIRCKQNVKEASRHTARQMSEHNEESIPHIAWFSGHTEVNMVKRYVPSHKVRGRHGTKKLKRVILRRTIWMTEAIKALRRNMGQARYQLGSSDWLLRKHRGTFIHRAVWWVNSALRGSFSNPYAAAYMMRAKHGSNEALVMGVIRMVLRKLMLANVFDLLKAPTWSRLEGMLRHLQDEDTPWPEVADMSSELIEEMLPSWEESMHRFFEMSETDAGKTRRQLHILEERNLDTIMFCVGRGLILYCRKDDKEDLEEDYGAWFNLHEAMIAHTEWAQWTDV